MDDLSDLAKWQATCHPDFAERKPDELFQREFSELYSRLHEDIRHRIVRLHGTIETLETLADFPFDYLYGPNQMEFWCLVGQNSFEMTIVLLNSLVNDKGKDAHTILKFRNEISRVTWLDTNQREVFRQTLRSCKFDSHAESVRERIGQIRDKRIAHRLVNWETGYLKDQLAGVDLLEIRNLFDWAHKLFAALSFGSTYARHHRWETETHVP